MFTVYEAVIARQFGGSGSPVFQETWQVRAATREEAYDRLTPVRRTQATGTSLILSCHKLSAPRKNPPALRQVTRDRATGYLLPPAGSPLSYRRRRAAFERALMTSGDPSRVRMPHGWQPPTPRD